MLMVLVKSPLIHILQAVVNSVLLDKVLMLCNTLTLPARMSSLVPPRTHTIKFAVNIYRLRDSSLGGTS